MDIFVIYNIDCDVRCIGFMHKIIVLLNEDSVHHQQYVSMHVDLVIGQYKVVMIKLILDIKIDDFACQLN